MNFTIDDLFKVKLNSALKLDIPLILGEFGKARKNKAKKGTFFFQPPKDFGPKGLLKEFWGCKSYDSMHTEGPGALAKKCGCLRTTTESPWKRSPCTFLFLSTLRNGN